MLLKLAVLRLKQVHDSVVLKSPTLFHPGNQRTMFPLGWGVPSSSHLGSPASWTKFIPKEKCWSFHHCWWQQPGTKLKLIFILNHLQLLNLPGTGDQVSMVLSHFCTSWGQRYQVFFYSKLSCQGYLCKHKTSKDWDGLCLQNHTANVFWGLTCLLPSPKPWVCWAWGPSAVTSTLLGPPISSHRAWSMETGRWTLTRLDVCQ